ncbi:hypothetical protein [Pseudomonas sp.]|uniref:hypothetical protein n=1 Tax=Pseudomonas sp. TaxID=306 RepID=UPI0028AE1993|nr:hypothetical protein [Pseudomonas sp.]
MTTINLQQSFTARLEGQDGSQQRVPILLIERQLLEVDSSGWLCLPADDTLSLNFLPATLRFDFLGQHGDSGHYRVSCATRNSHYFKRHLDCSSKGYLGFYGSVASDVFWKIDVVDRSASGGSPVFTLSDHRGRAVGSLTDSSLVQGKVTYLAASDSKMNAQHFTLADYQPI